MRTSKVSETIKQYFRTTTLHGFKYLCSVHCVDRVGWLVCCCASACCAGVLCAVLWARFLEVPALLALSDDIRPETYVEDRVPTVAVCPPPESVANMILEKLSNNTSLTKNIPLTFGRLLTGKSTSRDQLVLLDELLASNNVTLAQVMMNYTPSCSSHTKRCRYQEKVLPCEQLFEKQLTYWGLCCIMKPYKLQSVPLGLLARSHTTQIFDLVVECTQGSKVYGCQFFTMYDGEEWVEPDTLTPSYYYMAHLRFTTVPEPNTKPSTSVENTCVHDATYSKNRCMLKCAEQACGCSDPLRAGRSALPACSAARLACLRANEFKTFDNVSCRCLPSCKKITTYLVLDSNPMTSIKEVIDPLYYGLNITPTTVVNLRVNMAHSRVFLLNPTETWLTLLSSLGGVFNMFLGVGLFSALEFLYLLIVKLPVAIRKSSEIDPTTAKYSTPGAIH